MVHPTVQDYIAIGINHWDAPVEIRENLASLKKKSS